MLCAGLMWFVDVRCGRIVFNLLSAAASLILCGLTIHSLKETIHRNHNYYSDWNTFAGNMDGLLGYIYVIAL